LSQGAFEVLAGPGDRARGGAKGIGLAPGLRANPIELDQERAGAGDQGHAHVSEGGRRLAGARWIGHGAAGNDPDGARRRRFPVRFGRHVKRPTRRRSPGEQQQGE
jgi:hypothetical protein